MKSLVLILMTLICFPARGTAAEPDFPWELFLPAITKMGSNLPLSCNDIAGCYNGIFTDSCPGFSLEGRINIALQNDCTFTVITNSGIHANGKFTKRDGNTYTGSGQTDSAGCGAFNIVMGDLGTSITANYKYVNGLTGSVPNASSGICKSAKSPEYRNAYWDMEIKLIKLETRLISMTINLTSTTSKSSLRLLVYLYFMVLINMMISFTVVILQIFRNLK